MEINKINRKKIEKKELKEVLATLEDSQEIANIQEQIKKETLKDKTGKPVFIADSKEYIERIIKSKRGSVFLYYYDNELVSFFEFACPDNPYELVEEYKLKQYLPNEDYKKIGVAESFVVMPPYRGNKLQVQMFERMKEIAIENKVTSIIGIVHPENIYSCNNFDICKYKTLAVIEIYGSIRLLKYKKLI